MTQIPNALNIEGVRLPYRVVVIDGKDYYAPRGIARNNVKRTWQVKLERGGEVIVKATVSDSAVSTAGTPEHSLSYAIRQLAEGIRKASNGEKPIKSVRGKGRGSKIEPIRVGEHLTLHWKIVNTTPCLYAMLYSPVVGKAKTVSIGSDKALAKSEQLFIDRVSDALVVQARIEKGSDNPYEAVSYDERKSYESEALGIMLDQEVSSFMLMGGELREQAEKSRADVIANVHSALALKTLNKFKGRQA